jgi:hypothetical protein
MKDITQTAGTSSRTALQIKAARIGRYYALHDYAEAKARSKRGSDVGEPAADRGKALARMAEQAIERAHALENGLADERPTTQTDALILAGWVRMLALQLHDGTPEATSLVQIVDRLVSFLEAGAETSLAALGLKAWIGTRAVHPRDPMEDEDAPL